MKRSEMLEILQHYYETDEMDSKEDAAINAHRVLRLIENSGMVPPFICKGDICCQNEWEPEDSE